MADQHAQHSPSSKERSDNFKTWIRQQLQTLHPTRPLNELSMTTLRGDAGFRQYHRLNTQPSMLAVDAPPAHEDSKQFVHLAQYLRPQGIDVPAVIAADAERGFLLIEDFGDQLLQYELEESPDSAPILYGEALIELLALQQSPHARELLGVYDRENLGAELALFTDWFLAELLQYSLSDQEHQLVQDVFTRLEDSALEQPQVLVHRDYHSRNLLLKTDGRLGIVDFQDALWGPITYDLVSLLRDCYLRWPAEQVRQWALGYGNMAAEAGLLTDVDEAQYLRWFDWMGLQRHLKVLGIFARLSLRDGKNHYMDDLPLVIRYVLEACQGYPELAEFQQWFEQRLLPLAQQQSWYRDYRCAGDRPE
ncbi:aminoglycoside phosphotransferase family protein [Marinimicrobium sp. ABcell2]|uniref:aminoglycoside phosphotransferase family protein n=1 Tax=Marinimicrobium sp. ABcell2 TaxID=3069751 RepID=UPI0027B7C1F7|nr:phosphotransferase [Marinimicrobium sp. ABcell2]MDQ2077589.1 phosphotransferase [Marinimicrobium sp. ABcell2]